MVKVNPSDDLNVKQFEYRGELFTVKSKFKMLKFFKALQSDPASAIELVIEDEDYARLEELEMDINDLKELLEKVSECISGDSLGN